MIFLIVVSTFIILLVLSVIINYFLVSNTETLNFENSHVLITGGSSGIGRALARKVFVMGAKVTLIARHKEKLHQAKRWILNSSDSKKENMIQCIPLDITAPYPLVLQEIKKAEGVLGGVDVVVNSAGYSLPCVLHELEMTDIDRLMKVNYMGSVQVTKAVLTGILKDISKMDGEKMEENEECREGMKDGEIIKDGLNEEKNEEGERMKIMEKKIVQQDGKTRRKERRVVFVSSQAGQMGLYGLSAYSASKFALRGLAESLQMELLPHNVRVCIAYPPDTRTPGYEEEMKSKPQETKLISDSSGLFEAEYVADKILAGVMRGDFSIYMGLEGSFINHLTAGMSPATSTIDAITQVLFGGILRMVGLMYSKKFEGIVGKCHKQRQLERQESKEAPTTEESKKK